MRLLSVSDEVIDQLQTANLYNRVGAVDAIVGCGDLPPSYLEFLVSMLNVPCFYVHGNHDAPEQRADGTVLLKPQGCQSLDLRVEQVNGLLLAGIGGVLRYRHGDFQYSEAEWQRRLLLLSIRVMLAQQRYRQRLDVLITHAPPAGLHDGPGAHRGPQALRRFIERFGPRYVIHGHVHLNYGYGDQSPLQHGRSLIVNTCGYQVLEIEPVAELSKARSV
ncbi:MAG: metallophosphoesterase [Herpetosiphonaceae bacterium]|nr:metallophosphoesterase [Herpetosiphonaceae bacterium]